jgi:L-threonylcarbamoyladenylate synthase
MDEDRVIEIIGEGGVGVLGTDTLYGLVGSAFSQDAVARIYELKRRERGKPLIVLIPELDDVERFGVVLSDELRERLMTHWPGPVSIVLPSIDEEFEFLSRGTDSIAFRLPSDERVRELLKRTGPLVAPSANLEGQPPATDIVSAKNYFGDAVDFYLDAGELEGKASTLIRIDDDGETLIRD